MKHGLLAFAGVMLLVALDVAAARGETMTEAGSWAFAPPEDNFTDEAVLDLRRLNEKVAGQSGFVRLSSDGMSFVRGDGKPIRFWSINSSVYRKSPADMDRHCRFLAKLGVNMIRLHASISPKGKAAITDADTKEIDAIWRFVAAAKKHGIYLTISPYWPNAWHGKDAAQHWGIAGYETKGSEPWGVIFFNERLQKGYRAWVKALYAVKNPRTGMALKDDPAVAIIQIMNEDSLLFYTFQHLKAPQRKLLRQKYAKWLAGKYGSLAKAAAGWGGARHKMDDFSGGQAGMYDTWEFARPSRGDKAKRMADQLEFLAWIQRKFYADTVAYYRNELKCPQLINAMNWKSADPVLMDDVERWTYTAAEVLAANRYMSAMHIGENRGYRIDPGHKMVNKSVMLNPQSLPCSLKQAVGHPMLITESAWVRPNGYRSEGPMLIAAYQSLTGVDSFYWFSAGSTTWLLDPRRKFWPVQGSYATDKWSVCTPGQIGQFPANALAFRGGYIKQADKPVVYEERSLKNMWRRKTPIISEGGRFDPARDKGDFAPESIIKQDTDPLAFLVGPVHVKFGGDERKSRTVDMSRYIDRAAKTVKSVTGQIKMDYGKGVCTVDAPRYQAAGGFLAAGGGTFSLSDVKIQSSNDYATVIVTSMDDKPLSQSGRVLVQVGTVARLNGWSARDVTFKSGNKAIKGKQIVNSGRPPWRIKNTKVTLTITNALLSKATLLDEGGYRAKSAAVTRGAGKLTISLPANTMYLIIE